MDIPLEALTALRRTLHAHAELSDHEGRTGELVREFLGGHEPDRMVTGLGGEGIAAVYEGRGPGPTLLVRADLDGLPIEDEIEAEWVSKHPGAGHKCGHDGHMTILSGLAASLAERRPSRGRAILLYQPAEETGQGAARVLADEDFGPLKPDMAVALHNLPGYPQGSVILRDGVFASASRGMIVRLRGASSHAAEPHRGRSPAMAVSQLIGAFSAAGQYHTALHVAAQATVIHARVGERAFGTSPGEGVVMATLRAHSDDVMNRLSDHCEEAARGIAAAHKLRAEVEWVEEFPVTVNDAGMARRVREAARANSLELIEPEVPFAWSEDFGHFTGACEGVLFGLGSGENHPALHNPDYDFPDEIIEPGVRMFDSIVRGILD